MCVIMLIEENRPSKKMIDWAYDRNMDGGGVAWREGTGKDAVVHWKKGLSRADMHKYIAELPLPFIAHFRLKSIGKKDDTLCHPFPINRGCANTLEGTTKDWLWFHNGTWDKWNEFLINVTMKTGAKLPVGKWNDTRAMAFLSSVVGLGFLDVIEAKGVAYGPGPEDQIVFEGDGWVKEEGIWMSNAKHIKNTPSPYVPPVYNQTHHALGFSPIASGTNPSAPRTLRIYCIWDKCTKKDIDDDGLCSEHRKKKSPAPLTSISGKACTTNKGERPSPYAENVERVREVARTQGPFQAQRFLASMQIAKKGEGGDISRSQFKNLKQELGRLVKKQEEQARKSKNLTPLPPD